MVRINAAARTCQVSYSKLIGWMKRADVQIDRKVLADLAVHDLATFKQLVEAVRPQA